LSNAYFQGCRVRYVKPLQLFVLLNVIYYFSLTVFTATTFTTPLSTQLNINDYYPAHARRQVDQKLEHTHLTYQSLEARYNDKTSVLSKTLMFLLIPVFAVLFFAFFFRKRKYFVEHLVLATHFWSFNLLLLGVVLPILTVLTIRPLTVLQLPSHYATDDNPAFICVQVCLGLYLFAMLRHFYRASAWYCTSIAAILTCSFFHIVWFYGFCLFEVTLRSI
jgi:hypothetical protein